jgi:RHS repeat-associated protein
MAMMVSASCHTAQRPLSSEESTGKERDNETGLDYFGARYYSGAQGRFLATDPIVLTSKRLLDPQQLNAYAYVRNNPLRFIDPNGEELFLTGNINEAKKMLCQILGSACINGGDNLIYNAKAKTLTVDFNNADLSLNEGANLINDLSEADEKYLFSVGNKYRATDKKGREKTKDMISIETNLPSFPDQHVTLSPPKGFDSSVTIDPSWKLVPSSNTSEMQGSPTWGVAFHEFAEAYGKVTLGIGTYEAGHSYAKEREKQLRQQLPGLHIYLPFSGEKQKEIRK